MGYMITGSKGSRCSRPFRTTGKSFEVDFCTVARWDESGQIIEENLFYDLIGLMPQIGLK